ncbi:hypothetical protein BC938DRAFT_473721 [Jimgerdemannia flammicorona]|uniref:Uncharacterized protein n=1 Tax=Jimgerdemannia flammicorona TaxID=994334 RepID=A0A433Q3F7_9FUNG|nr:hypothetical protein BC938DRAFT_473721 [Jimgerdemannia flammicorona]
MRSRPTVILFLLAPLVFLAVTTPIYAFRRKIMIMGSTSSVIWIGFWVLAMPVIMCLVAAVLAYGQDPDNQSNVITPTQSLHLQDTWSPASPKRPEAENEAIKSLNPNPAVEINQLQLSSYFNLLPSPRPANPHESSAARSARVANEMTSRTGMVSWHDFELGILETSPKPPPPPVRVSHALPAFEMHPNLDKPIWRPQPTQSYSGPSVSASTKEKESESIRTHMRRGSERSMESFGTFGATSSANNEL